MCIFHIVLELQVIARHIRRLNKVIRHLGDQRVKQDLALDFDDEEIEGIASWSSKVHKVEDNAGPMGYHFKDKAQKSLHHIAR